MDLAEEMEEEATGEGAREGVEPPVVAEAVGQAASKWTAPPSWYPAALGVMFQLN